MMSINKKAVIMKIKSNSSSKLSYVAPYLVNIATEETAAKTNALKTELTSVAGSAIPGATS